MMPGSSPVRRVSTWEALIPSPDSTTGAWSRKVAMILTRPPRGPSTSQSQRLGNQENALKPCLTHRLTFVVTRELCYCRLSGTASEGWQFLLRPLLETHSPSLPEPSLPQSPSERVSTCPSGAAERLTKSHLTAVRTSRAQITAERNAVHKQQAC